MLRISQLSSRGVISLKGPDFLSILQGITTTHITAFQQSVQRAQHTLFLNPQGRILTEAFLIKPIKYNNKNLQENPKELWLDVEADEIDHIIKHIKKYSLRKKIELSVLEDLKVFTLWGYSLGLGQSNQGESIQNFFGEDIEPISEDESYGDVHFIDCRTGAIGVRCLTGQWDSLQRDQSIIQSNEYEFNRFVMMHGIPEINQVKQTLPFLGNYDLFGSINFDKGCYQGQELISRTYHTGVNYYYLILNSRQQGKDQCLFWLTLKNHIRPQVTFQYKGVGFDEDMIDESYIIDLTGKQLLNAQGDIIGTVLCIQIIQDNRNNIGIAQVSYIKINEDKESIFTIQDQKVQVFRTLELEKLIQKYLTQVRDKQDKLASL